VAGKDVDTYNNAIIKDIENDISGGAIIFETGVTTIRLIKSQKKPKTLQMMTPQSHQHRASQARYARSRDQLKAWIPIKPLTDEVLE
jgi:hypothetical protein